MCGGAAPRRLLWRGNESTVSAAICRAWSTAWGSGFEVDEWSEHMDARGRRGRGCGASGTVGGGCALDASRTGAKRSDASCGPCPSHASLLPLFPVLLLHPACHPSQLLWSETRLQGWSQAQQKVRARAQHEHESTSGSEAKHAKQREKNRACCGSRSPVPSLSDRPAIQKRGCVAKSEPSIHVMRRRRVCCQAPLWPHPRFGTSMCKKS